MQREQYIARCRGCGEITGASLKRPDQDLEFVVGLIDPRSVVTLETCEGVTVSPCTCPPNTTPVPVLDLAALQHRLAESQAREAELRGALTGMLNSYELASTGGGEILRGMLYGFFTEEPDRADSALARPADESALNEERAKVWEAAAEVAIQSQSGRDTASDWDSACRWVEKQIRARAAALRTEGE